MAKLKKVHKVLGIVFSLILIFFSVSGIILNHRYFFRDVDIKRKHLPDSYNYRNWNNNAIRGSLPYDSIHTMVYGSEGVFLFDINTNKVTSLNVGIPKSSENKDIYSLVKTNDGEFFAISSFNIYRYSKDKWIKQSIKGVKGRLMNITSRGDSLIITSRDNIYVSQKPYRYAEEITIKPLGDEKYNMSLFRFVWFLHSGELFGLFGKIVVDIIGILFIIVSLSGILYTILFFRVKRKWKFRFVSYKTIMKTLARSINIHNRFGKWCLYLFLFSAITGGFLRPPLMLAIIRGSIHAIPFSHFDTPNVWKDKLRFVKYDDEFNDWIVSTSEGFLSLKTLNSVPTVIECSTPISVMGVNVMTKRDGFWLIGSFEGLYKWDRKNDKTYNFTSYKEVKKRKGLTPPSFDNMITALVFEGDAIYPVRYDYGLDNALKIEMPESVVNNGSMSLWNLALETHTGRIFQPIIGKIQVLYIFITSILIVVVLISGIKLYNIRYRKQKQKS